MHKAWKEKLVPNGTPIHFLADDKGTFTSSTGLESFSMRYPCYACLESSFCAHEDGLALRQRHLGSAPCVRGRPKGGHCDERKDDSGRTELRVLKLWKEERQKPCDLERRRVTWHPGFIQKVAIISQLMR
ncbi:uncharacterized protein EV420DRAFT_1484401 [Desarmillaria tabescens]|uniref:Uncharacterized protein n=1 Tax=Armillaria tabescens TaxID=1929756 RepID=A0AA39MSU0_ARMTA|nr:uncharacterized protein EV420DRAFT_1484401 [Desarmillaria tabescens]KAK0444963.1 hypothetical protein EV420DRAFT_1484401 [Desarmillaria tabescens]